MKDLKNSEGYIPRNKTFFVAAVAAAVFLVLVFVFNIPETTELYYVEADLYAFWIVDIILFWCSSRSLYIDAMNCARLYGQHKKPPYAGI